jgi:hypothetical protein
MMLGIVILHRMRRDIPEFFQRQARMRHLLIALFCALITLTGTASAEPTAKSTGHSYKIQELETASRLQQQKLDFFDKRLDYQDKRISDLALYLSLGLALFAALMTIIVIFFSLRSKREAVLEAKEEAQREIERQAARFILDWLNKDGKTELVSKIDEVLKTETDKALVGLKVETTRILNDLSTEHTKAHRLNEEHKRLIEDFSSGIAANKAPNPDDQRKLSASADNLDNKPPKDYQASDWMVLGLRAYWDKKYAVAAEFFGKAADLGGGSRHYSHRSLQ